MTRSNIPILESNPFGFSLIEVMIGMTLFLALSLGFGSLMTSQSSELKSLGEKLAIQELERTISANLIDICNAELTNSITNPSAPYIISGGPQVINLTNLHASSLPGAPIITSVGSEISTTVKVTDIFVKDIVASGVQKYLGHLEVKFDNAKLVRALKPIQLQVNLTTDITNKITGCSGGSYSSANCVIKTATFTLGTGVGEITCDPGYRAIGGGGSCDNGGGSNYFLYESLPVSPSKWRISCCGYWYGTGHVTCPQGTGTIYATCCP